MSRESYYDNSGAYRVAVKDEEDKTVRVWGPYATRGAAKGRRTSLQNWRHLPKGHIAVVEVIVGPWKALNE